MKLYKRLLSLLLVCVLLLGAFSTTASADDSSNFDNLYTRFSLCNVNCSYIALGNPFQISSTTGKSLVMPGRIHNDQIYFYYLEFSTKQNFQDYQSHVIFKEGEKVKFSFRNPSFYLDVDNGSTGDFFYYDYFDSSVGSPFVQFFDVKGNIVTKDLVQNNIMGEYVGGVPRNMNFDGLNFGEVPFDVVKFRVAIPFKSSHFTGRDTGMILETWQKKNTTESSYFLYDFSQTDFIFNVTDSSTGFFKSIIAWLENIKSGITDLFNSIAELPSKLLNGIKALFVPDEGYFNDYGDRWDELLSNRFGAIYQIGGKAVEFANAILDGVNGDYVNSIDFPVVNIPVGDGVNFKFGGWKVWIYNSKLDFLYTACQGAFGVASTLLFIKGMRRKYDEVMGVDS